MITNLSVTDMYMSMLSSLSIDEKLVNDRYSVRFS